MKILHYIPNYAPAWIYGGPVRSVSELCEELVRRRHDVTVFTTDAGLGQVEIPHRTDVVLRNGVKVHYFPRANGYGIKSPQLMHAVHARAAEFDLIHVSAIWHRTGPAACQAAYAAGVPYVISPRGALSPYGWGRGTIKKAVYYFLIEQFNLRRASGFHYTSGMEAAECERFRFGKSSCIVPNGIDFTKWKYDKTAGQAWRAKNHFAPDALILLYAGRLHHKKGLELLPHALRDLNDLPWQVVFVGNNEDGTRERLVREFAYLGLGARAHFINGVDSEQLVAAYSGSDIFLLPSLHENFGNVAVEAAACGCWVLASEQTGVAKELAELGVGDCLPREAVAWSNKLRSRAHSSEDRSAVLAKTREKFSRESTAELMERFYETVFAGDLSSEGALR